MTDWDFIAIFAKDFPKLMANGAIALSWNTAGIIKAMSA